MAGSAGSGEGEPEFQIAPLIDVLLVLLIFFMSIATTAVQRYDQSIALPVAAEAEKKPEGVSEAVFNIAWDAVAARATTTFEERAITAEAITPLLTARLKTSPALRVLVRADAACPVRHVSTVVDAAARAGVVDVTFAALAR